MKIKLRELYNKEMNLNWDDTVPRDVVSTWINILQLVKASECVSFIRCIKPESHIGKPDLIMSNDGSTEAMCATAHVRWQKKSGNYECYLLAAKTRVPALQRNSITAVMSTRLRKSIVTHSGIEFNNIILSWTLDAH